MSMERAMLRERRERWESGVRALWDPGYRTLAEAMGYELALAPYKPTRYMLEESAYRRACERFVCFSVCF